MECGEFSAGIRGVGRGGRLVGSAARSVEQKEKGAQMGLEGKVAIVTGAAQAIGYATAWELALEGAAVTVADIQKERGMAVVAAMRADGRRALFVETDVGDPEQLERMVAATVAEFGRVDILVNNAAIVEMRGSVPEETVERWDDALAVNVRGVALGTKFAVAEMRRGGVGRS